MIEISAQDLLWILGLLCMFALVLKTKVQPEEA
jgi:hypothetical protein